MLKQTQCEITSLLFTSVVSICQGDLFPSDVHIILA